jgi:hypothetical protein
MKPKVSDEIKAALPARDLMPDPPPPPEPKPKPRPAKLVCVDGVIVGDAVVVVSDKDPNWYKGPKAVLTDCVVTVRVPR